MPKLLSGNAKVVPASNLSTTRFTYVAPGQVQPALGKPAFDNSVLTANLNGTTSWVKQSDLMSGTVATKNVIYVSTDGSDSNLGTSLTKPKATISAALKSATAGMTIEIFSGVYSEINPLIVPDNVSIIGQASRVSVIPRYVQLDVFKLNSGSNIHGITVSNHRYPSYAFSIANNAIVMVSPMITACSSITGPFLADYTLFIPNVTKQNSSIPAGPRPLISVVEVPDVAKRVSTTFAGGGILVDGTKFSTSSLLNCIEVDQFIAQNQGGIGICVSGNAIANVRNTVTEFCNASFTAIDGGILNLSNCTSSYGINGLVSSNFNGIPYSNTGIIGATAYSAIRTIGILNSGSGYVTAPSISIAAPLGLNGVTARATATISGGKVTAITIDEYGSGYTVIPNVTIGGSATASVTLSGVSQIPVGSIPALPLVGTMVQIGATTDKFYVSAVTPLVGNASSITIVPVVYSIIETTHVAFYQPSTLTAQGHTFKNVGSGTTTNALPLYFGSGIPANEISELNYGRIYFTSVNESGRYNIGDKFLINQLTGATTISAASFNLTDIGAIGPLLRNGAPVGTQMREISNDVNLIASTNSVDSFTVPTQNAVVTYLINKYLPLTGGVVTGTTTVNKLIFTANSISSIDINQNIVMSPNGAGSIDIDSSRIINVSDPQSAQDVATKAYVDLHSGNTVAVLSANVADFQLVGDSIANVNINGNMLLGTTGTGQVKVTSTIDSSSTITGALIVSGGVGIAKTLYVGTSIHAPLFYGNLTGSATTVTGATQTAITQLGILTELAVGHLYMSGDTITNSHLNADLKLGITGAGSVIPTISNTINFGAPLMPWATGYFTNLSGSIITAAQPYIASLAKNVSIYDSTYLSDPSLSIGFADTNTLKISTTNYTNNSLSVAKFATTTTDSSGIGSGRFEFYPNGNLALTIADGTVTVNNDMVISGDLFIAKPILTVGSRAKTAVTPNDYGIQYANNTEITAGISRIDVLSSAGSNVATVYLSSGNTVGSLNIHLSDSLYIAGVSLAAMVGSWRILTANQTAASFTISITAALPDGSHANEHPTIALLNKQGFFGYKRSINAFTFIPSALITANVATGDTGTINANLVSSLVTLTGGSIDGVPIGATTKSTGAFTTVSTDIIQPYTSIPVTGGITTQIDFFSTAIVDVAKYVIKIKDLTTGAITSQDIMLAHDAANNIHITEYGILNTDVSLGRISALISAGILTVSFVPVTSNTLSVKLFKIYL
jgi:hypothetical protein